MDIEESPLHKWETFPGSSVIETLIHLTLWAPWFSFIICEIRLITFTPPANCGDDMNDGEPCISECVQRVISPLLVTSIA